MIGETEFNYNAGSDEFGVIRYETAQRSYKVGDKLELIVPHCDPVVNEYDQMYAIRKDRVEAVWPISARGDRSSAVLAFGVLRSEERRTRTTKPRTISTAF